MQADEYGIVGKRVRSFWHGVCTMSTFAESSPSQECSTHRSCLKSSNRQSVDEQVPQLQGWLNMGLREKWAAVFGAIIWFPMFSYHR